MIFFKKKVKKNRFIEFMSDIIRNDGIVKYYDYERLSFLLDRNMR